MRNREDSIRRTFAYRKSFFLNCWNAADHESSAMWRLYSNEGIAIISSMERMNAALQGAEQHIYCGLVDYIDYETETVDVSNLFNPVLRKRKSFDFENEVRFVWWDDGSTNPIGRSPRTVEEMESLPINPGIAVPCDLAVMIEAVVISPVTEKWVASSVSQVCERVGLSCPVSKSSLLDKPER